MGEWSDEGWSFVDMGEALITSHRVAFRGRERFLEWAFDKLVGLEIDEEQTTMFLHVINRQKAYLLRPEDFSTFL